MWVLSNRLCSSSSHSRKIVWPDPPYHPCTIRCIFVYFSLWVIYARCVYKSCIICFKKRESVVGASRNSEQLIVSYSWDNPSRLSSSRLKNNRGKWWNSITCNKLCGITNLASCMYKIRILAMTDVHKERLEMPSFSFSFFSSSSTHEGGGGGVNG